MKAENEPKKPYMGLLVAAGDGIPIQHGNIMFLVPEPGNMSRMIPVIFDKVTPTSIEFACGCQRTGCTRRLTYKLRASGQHHYGTVGQSPKG